MDKKVFVVVGAGRGIGNHTAEIFAKNGYQIVLVARNKEKLESYAADFYKAGIECDIVTADASDTNSLTSAFESIIDKYGAVDALLYNAAVLTPGFPTKLDSEELMTHYQVDVASALHCANLVIPGMKKKNDGIILFTGGGLSLYPMPEYTCVSIDKAALRALTFAMSEELKEKGIYVGTVTVMGNVAPGTHFDPAKIAEKFYDIAEERTETEYVFK